MSNFFILIIRIYQNTFAYFLGGHCKFYPSCSHYAIESFENHNFFYAFKLVLKRLLKCHPLSFKSGFDPVPLRKE